MKKEDRLTMFWISTAFGFGNFIGFASEEIGLLGFLAGAVGMIIFYADIDT